MYKDKEVKELLELVSIHESLTFQSQLALQREISDRGLSAQSSALASTIAKTSTDIKNLKYLKDLGFEIEKSEDSLKITRTIWAIITDIVAIVLGLLLSLYGFIQLLSMTIFAPDVGSDFSISRLIMLIIYGVMVLIGLKFLSGVKRFFDYLGFKLSKYDGKIILKNRFDLKLEERQVEATSFRLQNYKNRMILKLDDHDLLDSNANDIVQKMTIESLYKTLIS